MPTYHLVSSYKEKNNSIWLHSAQVKCLANIKVTNKVSTLPCHNCVLPFVNSRLAQLHICPKKSAKKFFTHYITVYFCGKFRIQTKQLFSVIVSV